MADKIADISVSVDEVMEQLANEIGILSGKLVVSGIKEKNAIDRINNLQEYVESLLFRIKNQDEVIANLRENFPDNHPNKRTKKK